jgi:6-phospho-beta-glucosidase
MKIAVVGGGSTYTPELVSGLTRLDVDEFVLQDVDPGRREVVGGMARRMLARQSFAGRLEVTGELDAAVQDADYVLIQIRVGGQEARLRDETAPLACGCIGQETTGAGGFAKAMRTVPVVLEIAERVRALAAPEAWIVDFTNPVGIVTRALLDGGHRAVGLCNVAIGFQRRFAGYLGVEADRVRLDHVGLNHLTWEREVRVDGTDRLPGLLEARAGEIAAHVDSAEPVLTAHGFVPSYYLRYYYAHDAEVAQQRKAGTRAAAVAAIEAELLRMYADPALDTKPALLGERGGAYYSEAAVALLASLLASADKQGTGDVQVVNVRNAGTFGFLPDDAVIEVPAVIGSAGPVPVPTAPLPPLLRGLVGHVSAYEELALDAALRGGRARVAEALLAHPLIGQHDLAEKMADRLIAENARFLSWA